MKINILDENNYFTKDAKNYFKQVIKTSMIFMELNPGSEVCISFVDDKTIRNLNNAYRCINRATDVLSFPQNDLLHNLLGDIVISVDTSKRHCVKYGVGIFEEINRLIVHGLLHLLGYDHKKKKETVLMREKESELLAKIESEN